MTFEPLGKILNKSTKRYSFSKGVKAVLVIDQFHKIIKDTWGENILEQVRALHLKDKKITIACMNSVAAQEIRLRESEILEKLNQELGKGVVEKLRYQL